jgi:methylmalonyl-CoA mutase C-terminal domain/subunit
MTIFSRLLELLRAQGATHVLVFGGGTIPKDDVVRLRALGVGEIFGPGTMTGQIVTYLNTTLREREEQVGAR